MPLELHLDRGKTPQSIRDGAVITIPSAFLDFFFFSGLCACVTLKEEKGKESRERKRTALAEAGGGGGDENVLVGLRDRRGCVRRGSAQDMGVKYR